MKNDLLFFFREKIRVKTSKVEKIFFKQSKTSRKFSSFFFLLVKKKKPKKKKKCLNKKITHLLIFTKTWTVNTKSKRKLLPSLKISSTVSPKLSISLQQ